ncbi:hypothetical protein BH11BAC2_BH11BAC2_23180 [soil metagenome]
MDAIWHGIADAANSFFIYLKPIGFTMNWLFGITIAIGVIYWLWYDSKVKRGGANYMANKGK